MQIRKYDFTFEKPIGTKLNCTLFESSDNGIKPLIIVFHGFKAYRRWGYFPFLGDYFASRNSIVITYDFSLNGILDEEKGLFDRDIFASNTAGIELDDAEYLISSIISRKSSINQHLENWNGDIYLSGHSRGSAACIHEALNYTSVRKIALWAPIAHYNRYSERQINAWREAGRLEFRNSISGQSLYLKFDYINEIISAPEKFDLIKKAKLVQIPVLIVHGKNDLTVKLTEMEELAWAFRQDLLEILLIERAGHTFGISHPFYKSNDFLDIALERTANFFELK